MPDVAVMTDTELLAKIAKRDQQIEYLEADLRDLRERERRFRRDRNRYRTTLDEQQTTIENLYQEVQQLKYNLRNVGL